MEKIDWDAPLESLLQTTFWFFQINSNKLLQSGYGARLQVYVCTRLWSYGSPRNALRIPENNVIFQYAEGCHIWVAPNNAFGADYFAETRDFVRGRKAWKCSRSKDDNLYTFFHTVQLPIRTFLSSNISAIRTKLPCGMIIRTISPMPTCLMWQREF